MADRLEVDLEGLSDFAANLESIRARLDATRAYVRSFEGDLGSGRVADAMEHFEGRWSDGRAKIDGNATTLSTMVTESVKAYRETDEGLRTALDESMQGRPGVSGPALRGDDPLGFSRTVPDSWFELDLRPQTRDSAIQSLVHDRRADRGHRRPPGSESRVAGRARRAVLRAYGPLTAPAIGSGATAGARTTGGRCSRNVSGRRSGRR